MNSINHMFKPPSLPDMFSTEGERLLRKIQVITIVPAYALLLPAGIIAHHAVFSLGLIPITFSAIYGLLHISNKAKHRGLNVFIDLFLFCFLLGIFVPHMVGIDARWGRLWNRGSTVLATFASMPILVDLYVPKPYNEE
jgi:hypothetical protein